MERSPRIFIRPGGRREAAPKWITSRENIFISFSPQLATAKLPLIDARFFEAMEVSCGREEVLTICVP
jgi:hypothetical protein